MTGINHIKPNTLSDANSDYPPVRIALNSNESAFDPHQYVIVATRAAASNHERYLENQRRC